MSVGKKFLFYTFFFFRPVKSYPNSSAFSTFIITYIKGQNESGVNEYQPLNPSQIHSTKAQTWALVFCIPTSSILHIKIEFSEKIHPWPLEQGSELMTANISIGKVQSQAHSACSPRGHKNTEEHLTLSWRSSGWAQGPCSLQGMTLN